MRLIADRYRKLGPSIEQLTDEVVVAQAWKKTHAYMRRHNWYADTLALDISAIGLESNAALWASELKKPKFSLFPLELVPAAKSEAWKVHPTQGWRPTDQRARLANPPIRPLAHLTVRDQTWATTVMLCLADCVESAQGDCAASPFAAQVAKTYSYGNRLLCDWKGESGWFRWGNAETYRKFFTDYQAFLQRPVAIGRAVGEGVTSTEQVYVVSLDITRFYDCIDRPTLIAKLQEISAATEDEFDAKFWIAAEQVFDWQWSAEARLRARKIGINLGDGLPQGLVAAGFFANAYLIEFDKQVGNHIGRPVPGADWS
jgi:hypothetical protein